MRFLFKLLSIFCLFQCINASDSDPIDLYRAGTLQVNLVDGFSAADALQVLSGTLQRVPGKKFTIGGFVDDSWQRKFQRFLMSDGSIQVEHHPPSSFSIWLSGVVTWDSNSFSKLCNFAFGANTCKENRESKVSYDALIYLQAFMRQHFAGQNLTEEKAVNFAANIINDIVEPQWFKRKIESQGLTFLVDLACICRPSFDGANVQLLYANYPGFLRGFLMFHCAQPIAKVLIQTVWAQHYLESCFGQTRGETIFRSQAYENLDKALRSGYDLLGFQAAPVINPHDAVAMQYEFLRNKRWCSSQQFCEWGDMLLSNLCSVGLGGIILVNNMRKFECAHYLLRCALAKDRDLSKAIVLLAETIFFGVEFDKKGAPIDTGRNPKAHYEYAAAIWRDFLGKRGQENNLRAKAYDKLAVAAILGKIDADENNKAFAGDIERKAFVLRAFRLAFDNYTSKIPKSFAGINLLQSYLYYPNTGKSDVPFVSLKALYDTNPFIRANFDIVFGQLAMQDGWHKKQDGSVLAGSEQAPYALECFKHALTALDGLTADLDRKNTITNIALANHNMARLFVKYKWLLPDSMTPEEKVNHVRGLLSVPQKCGVYSECPDDDFYSLFSTHVVLGLAYLNILGEEGLAVDEFRKGALKGERGAYEHYMRHSGFPLEDFFYENDWVGGDENADQVLTSAVAAKADTDSTAFLHQAAEADRLQQENADRAEALRLQDEARREAEELDEKRKVLEARKAEKLVLMQENIRTQTDQVMLPPVTDKTRTWRVVHVGKGEAEFNEILEQSQTAKATTGKDTTEMVRYLTLINAVQCGDKTGRPETLSGVYLADGKTPVLTRRIFQSAHHSDRMVYTLTSDERGNPVLTIYGLRSHDDTVQAMLRSGVAREKR